MADAQVYLVLIVEILKYFFQANGPGIGCSDLLGPSSNSIKFFFFNKKQPFF